MKETWLIGLHKNTWGVGMRRSGIPHINGTRKSNSTWATIKSIVPEGRIKGSTNIIMFLSWIGIPFPINLLGAGEWLCARPHVKPWGDEVDKTLPWMTSHLEKILLQISVIHCLYQVQVERTAIPEGNRSSTQKRDTM